LRAQEEPSAESAPAAPAKVSAKCFHSLVRFVSADAEVEARLPRQQDFAPAAEGKYYPQGTTFRVGGGKTDRAVFEFGEEVLLKAEGASEFAVAENAEGAANRTVVPVVGAFTVSLPRTFPTGLFSVAYPHFTAKDLAGESRHELIVSGDGEEAVVHVITGILALEGAHYSVARMGAADRIRIRTTHDALFTSMRGEAGDCKVSLDQGLSVYRDPMTGESKTQNRRIEFALTPQRAIKIFRKRSQVGGRMAVSVMTFDSAGEMRNRYTFAEGEASMNFGEEVVRIQEEKVFAPGLVKTGVSGCACTAVFLLDTDDPAVALCLLCDLSFDIFIRSVENAYDLYITHALPAHHMEQSVQIVCAHVHRYYY
jgi:hypothetical protein